MTVCHLYRSKQLATLLNRLGHCESNSFSVELETMIAKAVEQTSSLFTPQTVHNPTVNSLFRSEFDNFDQLINTLSRGCSFHTAHGIMLQEILVDEVHFSHGGTTPNVPSLPTSKQCSLDLPVCEELPDCFVGH